MEVSTEETKESLRIQRERDNLIRLFEERQRKRSERYRRRARRPGGRLPDGAFVYTAGDMPVNEFLDRAVFMDKVNRTINPRPFIPGVSRPVFKQLNLPQASRDDLKNKFFEEDGRLRRKVAADIDFSSKHNYIRFSNPSCAETRNDKRWQVPILGHSKDKRIGTIASRSQVESILTREGVINPAFEVISDLGLLLAGTEDQSLHYDIARQMTFWKETSCSLEAALESGVPGWEVDRLEYHDAMANARAPCSVLIGMGDSDAVHVGIQKDQIVQLGPDQKQCSVIHGEPGEELEIVRENEFLVVVSAKGCVFTGDFRHAGVNNCSPKSEEDALMHDLIEKLDAIAERHGQDRKAELTAVVDMLCDFRGLNKICRLHCSTNLLDTEMSPPPKNAIGFLGCLPNPPLTVRPAAEASNGLNGESINAPVTVRATLADDESMV